MDKRRALLDLPKKDLKKGQTYWETNNKHVKNMALFASRKPQSVLELVNNTMVGENRQKLVQFSTLFHVLKRGRPMVEFEQLRELLQHLQTWHMPHKHWSDVNGWEMAHHLHLQVLRALKEHVQQAQFVAISCDELRQWSVVSGFVFMCMLSWIGSGSHCC
jgi:hypothetical protein